MVCMVCRPRMVRGDDVGACVVTMVMGARIESDLGEVRI